MKVSMRKQSALLALLTLVPLAGHAGNIDYTFVEAGAARHYPDLSVWEKPERRDGAYLRGSFALNERLYAYGAISRSGGENLRLIADSGRHWFDYRYTFGQVGIGARTPISDRTDALVELAYFHLSQSTSTDKDKWPYPGLPTRSSITEKGVQLNLGIREAVTDNIEGWLKVGFLSLNSDYIADSRFSGEAGIQVKVTPRWGVVAEAQFLHPITTYQVGVRANF